jgi:Ca2+-binding RTX toxin-like protein
MGEVIYTAGARTLFLAITGEPDVGAADAITAGAGSAWIMGGQGGDTITRGNGGGVVLGDKGLIEASETGELIRVETTDHVVGGSDSITAGDGASFVFGGRDGDDIALGDGDHVVAGDVGTLDFVGGVRSKFVSPIEPTPYDGDDTVATGNGDTWVILGGGDDIARASDGFNIVLGDAGYIEGDTTGLYLRAESQQPATGGNDSIYGGDGRDVQFGGAGEDYLKGSAGDDFISGDGALITRSPESPNGLITLESRDIREGGDDTIIGDAGFDVLMGGIGDDTFDLQIADDIVVGEFVRLRLEPQSGGRDLVVSFLTPAVRDLDLLAQITLGVNFASNRSVVTPVAAPGMLDLDQLRDTRLDLLFAENDAALQTLLSELFAGGLDGEDDEDGFVPGLYGFGGLSTRSLLSTTPLPDAPPPEAPAEPAEEQPETEEREGGSAPELDEASLGAGEADLSLADLGEPFEAMAGWRMAGWRVSTDAA